MDLKRMRYHPMRFEIIRGDDDDRLDFWESVDEWEDDPARNPDACLSRDGLLSKGELDHLQEAEEAMWHYYTPFEEAGRNIFSLSPTLVQMLTNSAVDDIPTSVIRMPFKSLFLYFGTGAGIRSAVSGLPLDGVYVHSWISGSKHDSIALYGTPVAPWIADAGRWTFLKRVQEDHKLGYYENHLAFEEGETFGKILAAPFENPYAKMDEIGYWRRERVIKDALTESERPYSIRPFHEAIGEWQPSDEDVLWREQTERLARLVVNALCYLIYEKRDVELDYPESAPARLVSQTRSSKPTEARRAESKLDSMGYRKVYLCGRNLSPVALTTAGLAVTAHWRRGHWRHQACGLGLQDRKLVWIMPTLVNATDGQQVHGHIYE